MKNMPDVLLALHVLISDSQEGVVSIVTSLRAAEPRNCDSTPDRTKRFISSSKYPDGLSSPTSSPSVRTEGRFREGDVVEVWNLSLTHINCTD